MLGHQVEQANVKILLQGGRDGAISLSTYEMTGNTLKAV
jgi:hypothetical protein